MKAYRNEKLENAVAYFAKAHFLSVGYYPSMTAMLKYLAFFEFTMLKKTGHPPIGLEYMPMPNGPVAVEFYIEERRPKSNMYVLRETFTMKGSPKTAIESLRDADLDYYSPIEIEVMDALIKRFAKKENNSETMSEASHKEIRSWKKARTQGKSVMDFADEFEELEDMDELSCEAEAYVILEAIHKG